MAFYKQLSLPPLKLNTTVIHRGRLSSSNELKSDGGKPKTDEGSGSSESLGCGDMLLDMPSPDDLVEPSHHELQSKASIKGWEKLRSNILSAYTTICAMPQGQLCLICPNPAEYRCRECGPVSYYCKECLYLLHEKANLFHTPEQWEVNRV